MPVRAFVTKTFTELTETILPALEQALQSGSINQLRNNNTGFLTVTGTLTTTDVQRLYNQARYEAYLRVNALDDDDQTKAGLLLIWTNPYTEKVMRIEPRRSCPTPFYY